MINFKDYNPIKYFDVLLLSLVLNTNVMRFFLNTDETSPILYFLYIVAALVLLIMNRHSYQWVLFSSVLKPFYYLLVAFFLWSWISILWVGLDLAILVKFSATLFIAFIALGLDFRRIRALFGFIIITNAIYGLSVLASPNKVDLYMETSVNYLNMTLTVGLCFTLTLVQFTKTLFAGESLWAWIWWSGLSFLFFVVLMTFAARGVLLFPPLIALYFAYTLRKGHRLRFIGFVIIFATIAIASINYFLNNASAYVLTHMMHLFEDTEDESRIVLWDTCIDAIFNNQWLLFGAGCNGFLTYMKYYPHNVFLQCLADYGFILFIWLIIINIKVFRAYYKLKNASPAIRNAFELSFVSFLYYLLTFSKSFTLYEGLPLFVMIALCYKLYADYKKISFK